MANIRKELVLEFIEKYHPSTVQDLKRKLELAGIKTTDGVLLEALQELESEEAIGLSQHPRTHSFIGYLANIYSSWWVYGILLVSLIEPFLVDYPEFSSILGPVRAVLGLALLGYLPGYSTVRALFPGNALKPLERILLAIFLSVVVSIAIGVALGADYLFTASTSVVGSSIFTAAATPIAAYRRYSVHEAGKRKTTDVAR